MMIEALGDLRKSGQINMASAGNGSQPHIAGEMF